MIMRRLMQSSVAGLLAATFVCAGANAQTLKLRLSVESTPGAATQQMLASFRDFLKGELGDKVEIEFFDSGTLGD